MKPSNSDPLNEKLQLIRQLLLKDKPLDVWEIGNAVNQIRPLVRQRGFRSTRKFLKQELGSYKEQTLYRYARVARHFSKETIHEFRLHKLQVLITYQRRVDGRVTTPHGYQVQVPQEDGSVIAKKFKDCHLREMTRSSAHRRKTPAKRAATEADRKIEGAARLLWLLGALILLFVATLPTSVGDRMLWLAAPLPARPKNPRPGPQSEIPDY